VGKPRVPAAIDQHQCAVRRVGHHDFGEMAAFHVSQPHARTQVLQPVRKKRGMSALGLETSNEDASYLRQPLDQP
jgi:hypothetical protein